MLSDAIYLLTTYAVMYIVKRHNVMKFVSHCVKSWGTDRGLYFYKETDKIYKTHFFRIFSIFVFRCMIKQSFIGGKIAPVIAIDFSGLV